MTHPNKRRGNDFERRCVELLTNQGFTAKRVWGSDGRSHGLAQNVDVYLPEHDVLFQCKKKRKLPDWLGLADNIDGVLIGEDHKPPYVVVKADYFAKILFFYLHNKPEDNE